VKARGLQIHSLLILVIVFAIFLGNLLIAYPGAVNYDSREQYAQAVTGHFLDWHPPIMAWVWSILRLVADGSGPLFAVHVFCYWLGFGLIALTLSQMRRNKTAWAVVAAGVFPPFLLMNAAILKDVSMAVAFISAFSVCFFYRTRGLKIPFTCLIIAMGLIIYGALVRTNGIFAAVPLFVYLVYPVLFWRPIYFIVVSLALIAIWIPVANLFNHRVLRAEPNYPINSLMWFDLAGIAYFSEDESVFGADSSPTAELVRECYTPVAWDPLFNREICAHALTGHSPHTKTWISAIITHPMAYAVHRLAHFNSELFFIVPRNHTRDVGLAASGHRLPPEPVTWDSITNYLLSKLSVFGFMIGVVILGLCYRSSRTRPSELDYAIACIAISGVMYTLAYLIVGVATVPRYQYWSLIAIFIASIIFLSKRGGGSLSRPEWACVGVLAITLIAVVVAHAAMGDALAQIGYD
jgi:hypothetical protein